MSSPPPQATGPVGPDTLITVKVVIEGQNRRFKLALRDLGAHVLPQKLRFLLAVPPDVDVKFDRFSDSAGAYITLDSTNPSIYKQLYRAAKAKLKLRLRATIVTPHTAEQTTSSQGAPETTTVIPPPPPPPPRYEATHTEPLRPSYLQTVLAPSSHGSRDAPSATPSFQSLYASTASGLSSLEAALHKEMQDRVKLRLDAQLVRLEKEKFAARRDFTLPARPKQPSLMDPLFAAGFAIDCNNCGKAIANEHYHCSICDSGDFDLCQACVDSGITCDGKDHWLIKRLQQGGSIVPSFTEIIAPKAKKADEPKADTVKNEKPEVLKGCKYQGDRTCNSCISELPGEDFVSCDNCQDFDLCLDCFAEDQHGHHPAHSFRPVSEEKFAGTCTSHMQAKCDAGRGVVHEALCDGCDTTIIGVRHKCLNCPDWDYCSTCYLSAEQIHPGHRFAPLYEPLVTYGPRPETHFGIYCDGPLCAVKRRKNYIRGDRFKCAVCHDTDYCANCEATPTNDHNKTHPLIKFKTPVRHVSVTTLGENNTGQEVTQMGDNPLPRSSPRAKNASTETAPPAAQANAATQVQTVAEVKPAEAKPAEAKPAEVKVDEKDLQAWFESDTTPDGSEFAPNRLVAQSWTIRNPGPHAWPAGCAVYYVSGDDMRNLDTKRPSSVSDVDPASHSNVLENSLEPHQTAVFNVLLKSPAREGRVISYWRLKTPQGKPFGHKLWVDITVANKPAEEPKEIIDETFAEDLPKEETSQMIFPKLEKESPVSSVHDVSTAPVVAAEPEPTDDLLDVDSLESDDGFMTDEEYDILDASDEDYLMAQSQLVARK